MARAFRQGSRDYERRIVAALGNPPNIDNVPAKLWDDIEAELAKTTAVAIALMFLAGVDEMGKLFGEIDADDAGDAARKFADKRAAKLARDTTRTMKDRLGSVADEWADVADDVTAKRLRSGLLRDLRGRLEQQADDVGVTETTFSNTIGENYFAKQFGEDELLIVWRTQLDEKVCPICSPLEGTTKEFWGEFDDGPPGHTRCRCYLSVALKDSAVAESILESFNPDQPRGDDGKWVSDGAISAAVGNAAKEKQLRDGVTDPKQRAKLDKKLKAAAGKPSTNKLAPVTPHGEATGKPNSGPLENPTVDSISAALDKDQLSVANAKRLARQNGLRDHAESRGKIYDAIQRAEKRNYEKNKDRPLSDSQKAAIAEAKAESDRERAIEDMQVKQLIAAETELEKSGAKRTYDSPSGSSYWELPNGQTLRLSDHALPANDMRDSRTNDPWDNEIIFSTRFASRNDEKAAIGRVRELLSPPSDETEPSPAVQSWAAAKFKDPAHAKAPIQLQRHELPQLSGDDKPQFFDRLKSKGVAVRDTSIPVGELQGVQTDFSPEKVKAMADKIRANGSLGKSRPMVSNDGYVVDGHHRWRAEAAVGKDRKLDVTQVDLPARELIKEIESDPKSFKVGTSEQSGERPSAVHSSPVVAAVERHYRPANARGTDTFSRYRNEDGTYTPQRRELHDRISSKLRENVPPSSDKAYLVMGGGPASGKSSIIKAGLAALPARHVLIDSDAIKAEIPEYQALSAAKDLRAAEYVHDESSDVATRVNRESFAASQNVVLDGTGDGAIEKLEKKVALARAAGYKVNAEYATSSVGEAIRRNQERAKKTGRLPPENFLRETHKNVSKVLPEAVKRGLFDGVRLWDTENHTPDGKPTLVMSAAGSKMTVHDPKLWQAFLDKAK